MLIRTDREGHWNGHRTGAGVMRCAMLIGAPSQGSAKHPAPGPIVPYRAAIIAVAQPASVAPVAQDRPVVFRFASLAPPAGVPNDSWLTPGAHQPTALICSPRYTCADQSAVVTIVAPAASGLAAEKSAPARRRKLLDVALDVTRKLLIH